MEMIMTAGMVTADEAQNRISKPRGTAGRTLNSVMEWHKKIMRNSPLAISKAIKSINANYKDENGFETEINLSKCLEPILKELQP
jgi:enoyl-CoA hydratase